MLWVLTLQFTGILSEIVKNSMNWFPKSKFCGHIPLSFYKSLYGCNK